MIQGMTGCAMAVAVVLSCAVGEAFQLGVGQPRFLTPSTFAASTRFPQTRFLARDNRYYDDEDDAYYDDDEDLDSGRENERRPRRRRGDEYDDLGNFRESTGLDLPSSFGRRRGWRLPDSVSKALLAGVFVLGVGLGVTVDSQVNTNPKDLASRDAIDNAAPNPTICAKLGASAMAFDQRVFISFNPFNLYTSAVRIVACATLRVVLTVLTNFCCFNHPLRSTLSPLVSCESRMSYQFSAPKV